LCLFIAIEYALNTTKPYTTITPLRDWCVPKTIAAAAASICFYYVRCCFSFILSFACRTSFIFVVFSARLFPKCRRYCRSVNVSRPSRRRFVDHRTRNQSFVGSWRRRIILICCNRRKFEKKTLTNKQTIRTGTDRPTTARIKMSVAAAQDSILHKLNNRQVT